MVKTPGGGGYGRPFDRTPEAVLRDVMLERYTILQASELFGVAIVQKTMRIDAAATRILRNAGAQS